MRYLACISLIVLLFTTNLAAKDCEQCPERSIVVYDCFNKIPQPTDHALIPKWMLFHYANSYRAYFTDNQKNCLRYLDASRINATMNDKENPGMTIPDPSHPVLPPAGSFTQYGQDYNYIIYGTIEGVEGNYRLQLQLETAYSRKQVASAVVTFARAEDAQEAGVKAAKNLLHGSSLFAIISDFEHKERDSRSDVAREAKLALTAMPRAIKPDEASFLTLTLTDCDGTPLKNRTIVFEPTKLGKIEKNEVTTDAGGIAVIGYMPRENGGTEHIVAVFKFEHPDGGKGFFTTAPADIDIKKVKEFFDAHVTVKAITVMKQFDADGQMQSRTETETSYSTDQELMFNDVLFDRISKNIQNIDLCETRGVCQLLTGDNNQAKATAADPTPIKTDPVTCSMKSTTWSKCDDQTIVTGKASGGGIIPDQFVGTMISILKYRKNTEEPEPIPLVKVSSSQEDITPVPLTNPNFYIRLSINLGGIGSQSDPKVTTEIYDCDAKAWTNTSDPNPRSGLRAAGFSVLEDEHRSINEEGHVFSYVNPIFIESELMNFLKNPTATHTFNLKAREYKKESSWESQSDIYVTLSLR